MDEEAEDQEYRRGIPAARSNLWVARIAAQKYLDEAEQEHPDKYEQMLYYGAFFLFARSALYALESSDGKISPYLTTIQKTYFLSNIRDHPTFLLLKGERDRIGHGDDSWGRHPMMPLGMLDRFERAGMDWSSAAFDDVWPDGHYRGQSIGQVLNAVWRTVSDWLDTIDVQDDAKHKSARDE